MPQDCVFCRIVAGEVPARIIREGDRTLAFMDINPVTKGHSLVVPKAHSRDLLDASPDDLRAVITEAQQIAQASVAALGADGDVLQVRIRR